MTLYSGFSTEFCTAVAVVVTGVTLIYMAKKVVYIMHVDICERPGLNLQIQYGGHISTLQRGCGAIVQSFCGLLIIMLLTF